MHTKITEEDEIIDALKGCMTSHQAEKASIQLGEEEPKTPHT